MKQRENSDSDEKPHASVIDVSDNAQRARHERERLFKSEPLHEIARRGTDDRLEDAVEMKRREHRHARNFPQSQRFVQMVDDVIDRQVNALRVRRLRARSRFLGDSQDLPSPFLFAR